MRKCLVIALSVFCLVAVSFAQDNAPAGKFSGYMFGDYYYNVARDSNFTPGAGHTAPSRTALSGPKDMQGFQFRRIYLAYTDDISTQFTALFRLEADQTALSGNKILPVVKDANLKWKNIFGSSDLIFGIQPTTAFDISEAAWGYRSIEKTIMDLRGVVPSRDFGLALKGKIDDGGMWNYWAMVANGDGNSPNSSKYHRYSLNLQVKPDDNWMFDLNGDYRDQANVNDPTSTAVPRATLSHGIMTGSAFVNYKQAGSFSLGLEAFLNTLQNSYFDSTAKALTGTNAMGISVWATVNLQPDLALIGRYDYYDPNTNSNAKGDMRNYIIAGLSYKADKNVSIIPNIEFESYEAPPNGTAPDASVNARVTFYYIFL